MAEMMKATSTPRMVRVCESLRPIQLPPNWVPKTAASAEPTRGASGTASSVLALRVADMFLSALQGIEVLDVDAVLVAEQQHQNGQANGRLGGGHGEDEEHEDLSVHVTQVAREGHEIDVHRQQHEFDRHQQHDQVLAVEEDAHHSQREQHRANREVVSEGDAHHFFSSAAGSATGAGAAWVTSTLTTCRRSRAFTRTWMDGSMALLSLRWRRVRAMAATMATSRMAAAIWIGIR